MTVQRSETLQLYMSMNVEVNQGKALGSALKPSVLPASHQPPSDRQRTAKT